MRLEIFSEIKNATEHAVTVSDQAALAVLESESSSIPGLMALTSALREKIFGRNVTLCSIINAKCGACSEDCRFCAQSAHYKTGVESYDLISNEAIASARDEAEKTGVARIGIVTSGNTLTGKDIESICSALQHEKTQTAEWCASLGAVSESGLTRLKSAGVGRYHHNLETARSFFKNVCTTHTYEQRLETLRKVRAAGMQVCSGGILGIGETNAQRVELARALHDEAVDSIPLNFLVPVPGTPLENCEPMKPLDMIRCIIMFRLVNPKAEIRICAGRIFLRDLQSWIFSAGATGMMLGNLLTTAGREVETDLKMLSDLEMDLYPLAGKLYNAAE